MGLEPTTFCLGKRKPLVRGPPYSSIFPHLLWWASEDDSPYTVVDLRTRHLTCQISCQIPADRPIGGAVSTALHSMTIGVAAAMTVPSHWGEDTETTLSDAGGGFLVLADNYFRPNAAGWQFFHGHVGIRLARALHK